MILDTQVNVGDLTWMEIQVAHYRQGMITVHVDFINSMLTWKDSNRWFNDFVKTFSPQAAKKIKAALQIVLDQETLFDTFSYRSEAAYAWRVMVGKDDSQKSLAECGGLDRDNASWLALQGAVEEASGALLDPIGGH